MAVSEQKAETDKKNTNGKPKKEKTTPKPKPKPTPSLVCTTSRIWTYDKKELVAVGANGAVEITGLYCDELIEEGKVEVVIQALREAAELSTENKKKSPPPTKKMGKRPVRDLYDYE